MRPGLYDYHWRFVMRHFFFFFSVLACLSLPACEQRMAVAQQPGASREVEAKIDNDTDAYPLSQRVAMKLSIRNPRIVVFKSKRKLELFSNNSIVRTYHVGLGFNPVDDKKVEGDGATPEGEFYIFTKNDKSAYYLSLGLSYPNAEDAERGLRERLISRQQHDAIIKAIKDKAKPPQFTGLGGLIYIHGNGAKNDWTWGCVALENEDMQELYEAVQVGTPVTIKP
jgi:murein L,D-transpeptidase YafK